jgi:hypothetical protein
VGDLDSMSGCLALAPSDWMLGNAAVRGETCTLAVTDVPTVGEFVKSYAVSLSPGLTQSESVCGYNCGHEVRRWQA